MSTLDYKISEFDYKTSWDLIQSWWVERKFPAPPLRFMPPTGVMVSFRGEPVVAGFLHFTDANIACIGHIVADPKSDKDVRSLALDFLLMELSLLATAEGFEMITCAANIPKLQAKFETLGFIKTDENVSHFGRVLCQPR